MTSPEPTTPDCRCPAPAEGTGWFWCDPHQCRKSADLQRLCSTSPAARLSWQRGNGPGQGVAIPRPAPVPEKPVAPKEWSWRSLKHFYRALVKHARDWFRKCSRKEIQARLAICETCDQYTGTACAQCGCRVNLEKRFRNKLAWRSESCPLGKWPALSSHRWGRGRPPGKSPRRPVKSHNHQP